MTWLQKSKGTKAAVDFVFDFLNIPLDFVNFKEYVKKIDAPINMDLLKKYLTIIYGTSDYTNLSVDDEGYPKYREEYIFEDNSFWTQFYVLDENLNGKYKSLVNRIVTQTPIYDYGFESTGSTFDYQNLEQQLLYIPKVESLTIFWRNPNTMSVDALLSQKKKHFRFLWTLLTFIVDVPNLFWMFGRNVWESIWLNLHINAYGGKPPYTFSGATDGLILPPETFFSVLAIDSIGCQSLATTGNTYCYNTICSDNPILVNLDYNCLYDDNGVPTQNASVIVAVSGGTPPYIIHGSLNGDILPNGEIIATEVIDALGCTSGIITKTIDCPLQSLVTRLIILLLVNAQRIETRVR